jgi:hypothetical protein
VLRTAVILLLSKYRFRGWEGDENRTSYIEFLENKSRRLLFQSMMQGGSQEGGSRSQRSDEEDEDLIEVLQALQELDEEQNEDSATARRKLLHLAHDLPSSNSTDLGGVIPLEEFRKFVRLMLLYRFPFGVAKPSLSEIDMAEDAIMESFVSNNDRQQIEGISWPAFDRALRETMVSWMLLSTTASC